MSLLSLSLHDEFFFVLDFRQGSEVNWDPKA